MKNHIRLFGGVLLFSLLYIPTGVAAQKCKNAIYFSEDTLVLTDGVSRQQLLWKEGKLHWLSIQDIRDGPKLPDAVAGDCMPALTVLKAKKWTSRVLHRPATLRCNTYSEALLTTTYDSFTVRLTVRIYENTPGTEWGFELNGRPGKINAGRDNTLSMIEDPALLQHKNKGYFYLPSDGHFQSQIVRFNAATDYHNNLVQEIQGLPYKNPQFYQGNILQMQYKRPDAVHEIVKLAPLQDAQSAYAGFDFSTGFEGVNVYSPGWAAEDRDNNFQKGYALYVVLFAKNKEEAAFFYKQYELNCHHYIPHLDNTFTMNTWGDRHKDGRIGESFILKELNAAARLGITQYQIDDGWQQGASQNSAKREGQLWDHWSKDDWQVNKQRFPNGLAPVTNRAKAEGIAIGLWFNPSKKNHYADWKTDEDILADLYRKYDIRWIKIDGIEIGDKKAEQNVMSLLNGVQQKTNGRVQFNMDLTAGKRGSYFFLNRLGNLFLENRYTDWGNYYPYLTLRNVWQLARYVPVQRLQIEWLNKWRNENKYALSDSLRPAVIPFDYQFAVTMTAQPLAWMEATGLPEKAFDIRELIALWKLHRSAMDTGIIQPVGDCPDGYSFPGFVSIAADRIYVLFFREWTDEDTAVFNLPLADLKGKKFIPLYGRGVVSHVDDKDEKITVRFTHNFQFIWGYFE